MLETYLIPLGPYALLALMLIACLLMFGSHARAIRRLRSQLAGQKFLSDEQLQQRLDPILARLVETETRCLPAARIVPSLNMNKRNQLIRMSRRGQSAALISTSLSLPKTEVELLLKINNLTSKNAAGPAG